MAARWLIAKKSKMRKAYLKRPKSSGPNAIALAEYQARGRSMPNAYRDKLFPGKMLTEADIQKYAGVKLRHVTPSKGVQSTYVEKEIEGKTVRVEKPYTEIQDPVPPPVRMILDRRMYELHQSQFFQKFATWNSVVLFESAKFAMRMYFSSNKFVFVEAEFQTGVVRKSIFYTGRDSAMYAFEHNRIVWKENLTYPG